MLTRKDVPPAVTVLFGSGAKKKRPPENSRNDYREKKIYIWITAKSSGKFRESDHETAQVSLRGQSESQRSVMTSTPAAEGNGRHGMKKITQPRSQLSSEQCTCGDVVEPSAPHGREGSPFQLLQLLLQILDLRCRLPLHLHSIAIRLSEFLLRKDNLLLHIFNLFVLL